jgi:ATP-dependent RNA helicase DeaD
MRRVLEMSDGRRGRQARRRRLIESRQRRELEAIERHARTTIAPWIEGAHVKPEPVVERPHRHEKPHVRRNGREPHRKLIVGAGRASGLEVADLVTAITRATGLDGEAVRNVRVLERFSFLEVPASDVPQVLERVNSTEVRGTSLRLERAAS